MLSEGPCRICGATAAGRQVPILLPGPRLGDWHLCRACWRHVERGLARAMPAGVREPFLRGRGFRFTEQQLRHYVAVGLRAAGGWQGLVRGELRELGAELAAAVAASDRDDWDAVLAALGLIQGRVMATHAGLERGLGRCPSATDLPPLVRAVRLVGRLISRREVDRLPCDELRARMHAVLQALDRELRSSLRLPEGPPGT